MPPQGPDLTAVSPTTVLPLQDWLKLLASRGVDMRVAMGLAAKIYNSHNNKQRLSELDAKKLTPLVPDKEHRKAVLNAVKGIATGEPKSKKRTRDSDLMEPLKTNQGDDDVPRSLEFNEILDPENLIPVSITVNRAPVKTAWAYAVARRLGFDVQEALSIAHVHVHISSLKHAIMLGNILNPKETREAEEEIRELPGMADWGKKSKGKGREREVDWKKRKEDEEMHSSQPWVMIMRSNPVIERTDGTWRAIEKGIAIPPSQAYKYITRAFKDYTSHVLGAMKLVAESHPAEDLNNLGTHMYNEFKPEVEQWGQRGILQIFKILDCAKGPVTSLELPDEAEEMAGHEALSRNNSSQVKPGSGLIQTGSSDMKDEDVADNATDYGSILSDPPDLPEDLDAAGPTAVGGQQESGVKKRKTMTVEEYEAMLDAETQGGGFLEGVDIFDAKKQDA